MSPEQISNEQPRSRVPRLLQWVERPTGLLARKSKARWVYLLAFFMPFTIVAILWLFGGASLFGPRMILAHDQWHQYFPFYLDLTRKLQNGGSLFYSWTTGMGTNYLSLFAYYLSSPFNFIAVLLPEGLLLPFYTLAVLIRIGCAGLFFAILLRKLCNRQDATVAFFATAYALCAYIMGYYWNAIWLDTIALLPLVVLGMFRLLHDKKFILFTATLALSLLCSYYIGLFTCIFVLLLFIVYNVCFWDDLGGFGSRFLRIGFFSLLAVGMTAFLTLPAYLGLQSTSSSANQFPTGFSVNIATEATFKGVLDAVRQVFSNLGAGVSPTTMEGLPNIYCGVVTVILGMLFFCCKKIKVREKICCALLLVFFTLCFIIRQADYIMHGCHFPNMLPYRFSFLFSFVLIWMAYRAFTQLERLRWYHLLIILPLVVGFLYCVFSMQNSLSIILTCVFAGLTLLALVCYSKQFLPRSMVSAVLCLLLFTELFVGAGLGVARVSTTSGDSYPRAKEDVQTLLSEIQTREADTVDLYRTEVTKTQSLNDDALNGYNGVSTFSSAANSHVSALLKTLGVAGSVAGNRYVYQQADPFTNMLLGLKYLIDREGKHVDTLHTTQVASSGGVLLLENNSYLPLGYMTAESLLDYSVEDASEEDVFSNLNSLYQCLSGNTDQLYVPLVVEEPVATAGVALTSFGNGYCKLSVSDGDYSGYVSSSFTVPYQSELCLFCQTWSGQDIELYVNDVQQYSYSVNYGYNRFLGEFNAGDRITVRVRPKSGKTCYFRIKAAAFRNDVFQNLYTSLSQQTMVATTVTDTEITGTIRVTRDGMFYASVPNDNGWTASVDGKPVKITPLDGAFIAFPLQSGKHTVTLRYETPGFALGTKISLVCLGVFLLLVFIMLLMQLTRPTMRTVQVELEQPEQEPLPRKISLQTADRIPEPEAPSATAQEGGMPPLDFKNPTLKLEPLSDAAAQASSDEPYDTSESDSQDETE